MNIKKDYLNLGYQNGWKLMHKDWVPAEYKDCIDAGHRRREENIGKCQTQVYCDICWITWKVDSGD